MLSAKNRGRYYLKCGTRHIAKESCIGSFVPALKLEEIVLSELHNLLEEYLNKSELTRRLELNSKVQANIRKSEKTLLSYKKRSEDCSKAIKDLYLDKSRGIITEDDFISLSKDFHAERIRLDQLIKSTQEEIAALNERCKSSADKAEVLAKYLKIEKLTREHVESLIDNIYVGRKNPETNEMPVEIHWSF
jgi:hypothetical protein